MRPAHIALLAACLCIVIFTPTAQAQSVSKALSSTDIFQGLGPVEMQAVASLGRLQDLPKGAELFELGVSSPNLYCLVKGKANVIVKSGETVAVAGPGTTLGEMELVDSGPASATVEMAEPGLAVVMKKKALRQLLVGNPALGYKVMCAIAKKISVQLRARN